MSTTEEDSSTPRLPSDSPGSSVSSSLQNEYNELLKYAVITPRFDPTQMPRTLAEAAKAYTTNTKEEYVYHESSVTEESSADDTARRIKTIHSLRRSPPLGLGDGDGDIPQKTTGQNFEQSTPVLPKHPRHDSGESEASMDTSSTSTSSESSTSSSSSSSSSSQSTPQTPPPLDGDVTRIEAELDNFGIDLKRGVLAEFMQTKMGMLQKHKQQMKAEREKHAKEINQLQNEMAGLKELLHTYEQSLERKDQVISNLTHALQKQKERMEMLKKFSTWKIRLNDDKREYFASKLAKKHAERKLCGRVWAAWHGVIEDRWRLRVEKACQAKAQQVCLKLTDDYEAKLASVNEAIESSREEVRRLHLEREHYEETMKKAFMRGVCALNLEAMSMFRDGEGGREEEMAEGDNAAVPPPGPPIAPPRELGPPLQPQHPPQTIPGQAPTAHLASAAPKPSRAGRATSAAATGSAGGVRSLTAKVTAKQAPRRPTAPSSTDSLAPPMGSVVVERHRPINQR